MSHIQLLRHAIEAARAGNPDVARQSLLKAAEIVPDDPVVWLWMSWLADSPLSMVQGLALAGRHESCREIAESGLRFARALARFDCHALERERSGWSSTEPVMPPDGFPAAGTGRALEYFPGEEIRSTDMAADTESNRLDAVSTIMDDPDLQADRNELHQTDPPALHGLGLLSRTADAVTHELLFDSNADQTGLFSGLMSAGTDRDSAGTSSRDALASEQKVMVEPAAGEGTSWYDCWLPRDHHPTAPADSENITLDQAAAGRNSQWQADAAGLPASEDFPRSLTAPRELQADPTAGWSSRQSETIEECSVDTQAVMPSKTHEGSPAKQSERMFSYRNPDRQGNTLRYVPPVARSAFQIPPGLTSDAGPALSSSSDHRISETDSDCDLTAAPARGWTPPQPVHDPVSFRQEDQSSGFDVDGRAAGIGIFNGPPGSPAALSSQPPLPDSHRIPGVTSGFLQSSGLGPAQGVRFPEVVNSPESLPRHQWIQTTRCRRKTLLPTAERFWLQVTARRSISRSR